MCIAVCVKWYFEIVNQHLTLYLILKYDINNYTKIFVFGLSGCMSQYIGLLH
jgi:hypothetical protein